MQAGQMASQEAGMDFPQDTRLICEVIDYGKLPRQDAEFFRHNQELSRQFIELEPLRRAYVERQPCKVVVFHCMDEKEQDTEKALGLPPGVANPYPTAGNLIGDVNLVLCKELQTRIDKAEASGKLVLLLFITHESKSHPHEDSCAAWKHESRKADNHAIYQVDRFNQDYVDRDPLNFIVRRHVVAVRLKSYTDLETRVWYGSEGKVDPMEFISRNGAYKDPDKLEQDVFDRFVGVFPKTDVRFEGLSDEMWQRILLQMARMCAANVEYARPTAVGTIPPAKKGHRGTRILVGRGWEMYDEVNAYFKVSDLTPDWKRECYIAGKYVIKNASLRSLETGKPELSIPFHINVPYDLSRSGDRSGSIRHAMSLARAIRKDWSERLRQAKARARFLDELVEALKHDGADVDIRGLKSVTPDIFNYYVSVSPRETRLLELVATGGDL